ncbi:BamA/TamA family outer membrane protein [Zunongwangia sp. HGR-M22]|uniref:BamA/TamA family outer membrane protein n=1 Tax=Zunongwangia sp. HGR-M22 TaxID=3015168 RepID=UPI0022DE0F93|nr:BamA/TamA family outer membrane protein [Zunongwangia sp. HGR-M22]WBL25342.1 BamA/TamA family outer membrane protein [Zunongwangia sp. HGR-M22]
MRRKPYLLLLAVCLLLISTTVFGQETKEEKSKKGFIGRYINNILNDTVSKEKSQFFVFPTVGYRPETGVEFGVTPLYIYYANEDVNNRLSEMKAYSFFTLNGQYGLRIGHALYSDKDKWFFLGDIDFEQFPLKYYGIGNDVPKENIALVDATQIRIKERVLRRVLEDFYIGVETDFRSLTNVSFEGKNDNDLEDIEIPFGAEGSTNFGLGVGLVYDQRHNVLNERDAFFSEFAYLNYNPFWDSDVEYQLISIDNRVFKKINERDVLAAQLFGEFNFGGDVPFNQLSYMGGESLMRGYFKGRFRDQNQIAAQVEYRFLPLKLGFTDRLGATIFTGVGEVFDKWNEVELNKLKWSAGAGARFLIFQKKDVYLRFDYAFTRDGSNFYISIGEAF